MWRDDIDWPHKDEGVQIHLKHEVCKEMCAQSTCLSTLNAALQNCLRDTGFNCYENIWKSEGINQRWPSQRYGI